jgi:hypothetical protein
MAPGYIPLLSRGTQAPEPTLLGRLYPMPVSGVPLPVLSGRYTCM